LRITPSIKKAARAFHADRELFSADDTN